MEISGAGVGSACQLTARVRSQRHVESPSISPRMGCVQSRVTRDPDIDMLVPIAGWASPLVPRLDEPQTATCGQLSDCLNVGFREVERACDPQGSGSNCW